MFGYSEGTQHHTHSYRARLVTSINSLDVLMQGSYQFSCLYGHVIPTDGYGGHAASGHAGAVVPSPLRPLEGARPDEA